MDFITKKDIKFLKIFIALITIVVIIVFVILSIQNVKIKKILKTNLKAKVYEDMIYYKSQFDTCNSKLRMNNIDLIDWSNIDNIHNSCPNYMALNEYISNKNSISMVFVESIIKYIFANYDYPLLMIALIQVESNFNIKAVSNKGAYGLMQIRWQDWEKELKKLLIVKNKEELYYSLSNIKAGDYIFKYYYNQCKGDVSKTLTAYNSGKCELDTNYSEKVFNEFSKFYLICKNFNQKEK